MLPRAPPDPTGTGTMMGTGIGMGTGTGLSLAHPPRLVTSSPRAAPPVMCARLGDVTGARRQAMREVRSERRSR